jgi:hypothetical protein
MPPSTAANTMVTAGSSGRSTSLRTAAAPKPASAVPVHRTATGDEAGNNTPGNQAQQSTRFAVVMMQPSCQHWAPQAKDQRTLISMKDQCSQ